MEEFLWCLGLFPWVGFAAGWVFFFGAALYITMLRRDLSHAWSEAERHKREHIRVLATILPEDTEDGRLEMILGKAQRKPVTRVPETTSATPINYEWRE